ncbi:hypothetical protein D1632_06040 [Chryseobacterium nematophagum]|uniref:Protein glutaminase domain-containing protein n=1 Tax=Chryseobacterium nematophagum TaxID=2305228 RepID=A0A3M7L9F3_9FLAO|nr:protein-glutamine glutaminase family protein [Chryseobacterium nematophagum]RMZ59207.1 hypothetical protein D1632_06040 [Chryseobacterium nematophagum]
MKKIFLLAAMCVVTVTMTSCTLDGDESFGDVCTSATGADMLTCKYFNIIKGDASFTWGYSKDGSFARAHKMGEILQSKYGIQAAQLGKIWIGNSDGKLLNGWTYHVAIVMAGPDGNLLNGRVIDPSLFDRPVTLQEWSNKCNNWSSNQFAISPIDFYTPNNIRQVGLNKSWKANTKVDNYNSSRHRTDFYNVTNCVLTTIKNDFETWKRNVKFDSNSSINISHCGGGYTAR